MSSLTPTFQVSGSGLQVPAGKQLVAAVALTNVSGMTGDYTIAGALLRSGTQTVVANLYGDAQMLSQSATGTLGPSQKTMANLYSAKPLPDAQTLGAKVDLQLTIASQTLQENATYVIPAAVVPATMEPPTQVKTSNVTSSAFTVTWTPDPLAVKTAILHTNASGAVLAVLATVSTNSAQITGLQPNAQEHFALQSIDLQGNTSKPSQVYSVTTSAGTSTYVYQNPVCQSLFLQEQALMSQIRTLQTQLASQKAQWNNVFMNYVGTIAGKDAELATIQNEINATQAQINSLTTELQGVSAKMQTAGCF